MNTVSTFYKVDITDCLGNTIESFYFSKEADLRLALLMIHCAGGKECGGDIRENLEALAAFSIEIVKEEKEHSPYYSTNEQWNPKQDDTMREITLKYAEMLLRQMKECKDYKESAPAA